MPLRICLLAVIAAITCQLAVAQDATDRSAAARDWVNSFRAARGLAPVSLSDRLTRVASTHAADMARKGYFSHTGSDKSSVGDRARRVGYGYCFIAENIAKGQRGLDAVLNGWAGSTGHRRNMLAPQAREMAVVEAPGRIWVMVLGRDGC